MNQMISTYCGIIPIIARPNVGKSTLINHLIKRKISITSSKANTTLQCTVGIHTEGAYQSIYIDTPGIYKKDKKIIDNLINYPFIPSLKKLSLIIFMIEGTYLYYEDTMIIKKLSSIDCPIIVVINKIDKIRNKSNLLPHIKFIKDQIHFDEILPICAKSGKYIDTLLNIVKKKLPKGVHIFPQHFLTTHSNQFIVSEIIREKLIRYLGKELPYSIDTKIEEFYIDSFGRYHIRGLISVERISQKKIIIGENGSKIHIIRKKAEEEIKNFLGQSVCLKLWINIK
ncbi:GTPase Era [Candidatus Schneideria nysicola]|uniref:GTPase Era n=1 Tax=Candidatus Schneideria nysicola TaxID=1081631 RepID=UPI001CAA5DBB|nr:GTPase Era [Candidatus Schneideria nysicola]UAJ65594.1 GTPase Era [Candidatus Schneideria nysicola]